MKKNDIDLLIERILVEETSKRANLLFEKKVKKNIDEKLTGKQHKIDKNKNGKIDAEDFKLLKKGKKSFKMNEDQLVSFIEEIINEANEGNLTKKAHTSTILDKSRNKSKSEANEYIVSVGKKMNEYLKTGSNTKYNPKPDIFPKSNGQLKKMETKAFRMDDAENEFIENLAQVGGMENLVYDEIDPDDKWLSDNIEGTSRTGNSKDWANAEKTEVNDKMNKKRKNNYYALEKERAYQKSQDVHLVKDEKPRPSFIKKMKESIDKNPILVEEFNKMQNLINYNKKTQ
jgi:hypothetical protein